MADDAATAAAAAAAATTAAAAAAATATAAAAATAWHTGIDADLIGVAQSKGWKLDKPDEAFSSAAKAYREAQSLLGVPKDQLLRIPSASAPEADIKAFWGRLGAVDDPKALDMSGIKRADGQPVDPKLAEVLAATAVSARIPKDAALAVSAAVVKHIEGVEAEAKALTAGKVAAETQALDKNWGTNKEANLFVAKNTLAKLAAAAGMTDAQATAAWDALSKVGGIGAAPAMEMLRVIGTRIGEDKFVQVGGTGSGNLPMTREAAKAEIEALKKDPAFAKKYVEGGAVETQRMNALHLIAHAKAA